MTRVLPLWIFKDRKEKVAKVQAFGWGKRWRGRLGRDKVFVEELKEPMKASGEGGEEDIGGSLNVACRRGKKKPKKL